MILLWHICKWNRKQKQIKMTHKKFGQHSLHNSDLYFAKIIKSCFVFVKDRLNVCSTLIQLLDRCSRMYQIQLRCFEKNVNSKVLNTSITNTLKWTVIFKALCFRDRRWFCFLLLLIECESNLFSFVFEVVRQSSLRNNLGSR